MKILVISPFIPYDNVSHAGGKTLNFYIKRLAKEHSITIVSRASVCEKKQIDLDGYGIKNHIYYYDNVSLVQKIVRKIKMLKTIVFPVSGYLYYVKSEKALYRLVYNLYKNNYSPDVISLEWTQCALLASEMKRLFPRAIISAFEYDVSFLNYYRRYSFSKSAIARLFWKFNHDKLKNSELSSLQRCDLIWVHAEKDRQLLIENGIEATKVNIVVPYYDKYDDVKRSSEPNTDIIFYGAMRRPENYISALWFIEKVFPLLQDRFRFVVIGSNPPELLTKKGNDRIVITGYQDDIRPWLQNSLCMVAPLVMGAGVKVKILEAFSSGIPVITNMIGIEGISAIPNIDYLLCDSPKEISEGVFKIESDKDFAKQLGFSGKKTVLEKYNFTDEVYLDKIKI
jgi:glycosyltransferase involved in cell wall biosynthesis